MSEAYFALISIGARHDGLPPYISLADNVIEIKQYKLCYSMLGFTLI